MKAKHKGEVRVARKRGRPSVFHKVDLRQARILAERGLTDREMADFFGMDERTWARHKAKDPSFRDLLGDGKKIADARVERSLYERAIGFEHPEEKVFCHEGEIIRADTVKRYPPDTTAMIFWLKNRRPSEWRDRQEIQHSGAVDIAAVLAAARARVGEK